MVVTHQGENAAAFRRAREIGVAKDVARAINARPLAVPHAEDAIELAFTAQFGLLAAPQRSGGEFLVDAWLELDVGGGDLASRAHELLVKAAERGTAIAGDITGRIEAGAPIALMLHEAGADQCLITGHQHMRLGRSYLSSRLTGRSGMDGLVNAATNLPEALI